MFLHAKGAPGQRGGDGGPAGNGGQVLVSSVDTR